MKKNYLLLKSSFSLLALLISLSFYGQNYKAQFISADTGSQFWCPGETRNISVTIKNIGTKPWKNQGTDVFNIGVKWNTDGYSWNDYNVRVGAQDLKPQETKTFTFLIRASNNLNETVSPTPGYTTPLAAGANNLIFDVVYEGQFWFGNNNGGGGPGNSPYKVGQTIGPQPLTNNSLSYSNGTSGLVNGTATENNYLTLSAPAGTYFSTVNFASYGLPGGTAPNFTIGTCHAASSQSVTEGYVLGNSTATIQASNGPFGDPCIGTGKRLYISTSYVQPICGSGGITITGTTPEGGNGTFGYQWESSTTGATSGFAPVTGKTEKDYSGTVSQTTWFRRVVTSCNLSSTSAVVLVKVNEAPTITPAATAAAVCTSTTAQTTQLTYSATTASPTTYSITWNNTPANTFTPISNAALPVTPILITVPANTPAGTYTGNITVKNANGCVSAVKTFTVTVNPTPAVPTGSAIQSFCFAATVAELVPMGTTIKWYTAASGGTPLPVNSPLVNGAHYYASQSNTSGCESVERLDITAAISFAPAAPTITAITQPTCSTATGSVVLNNLPAGPWVLTRNPGSITSTGTGTSATISGLTAGTYNFSVSSTNNGLKGEYFSNKTLSGPPTLTRTDATINFDWGNGSPNSAIPSDNFSVRWSGFVQPLYSETYTFSTVSDDGVRLWVNGVKIIDNWTDHGATTNTGTISLTAGVKYYMVLEYYENTGGAVSKLSWSSPKQTSQIIPTLQLFPDAGCPSAPSANVIINAQPATPAAPTITASGSTTICAGGSVTLTSSAGMSYLWSTGETTASIIVASAGSYSVRVMNADGCQSASSAATVVKVNPLAVAPGAPAALNLSLSGAVVSGTFTAPSSVPTGYVIARSTTSTMPTPVNGTTYTTGSTVGAYYIVRGTDTPSTAVSFTDTLPTNGTYYYYVFSFNTGCGTVPLYTAGISKSIKYICSPTSSSTERYISNIQFVGTLADNTANPTGYSPGGYGNYTTNPKKAVQIAGGAVNINFSAVGPANSYSYAKAWVDWNKDGIFETGELVFDSKGTGVKDLIFGYVIPPTTNPGFYTIRFRTSKEDGFDACGNLAEGETEDYTFEVIANCSFKITNVSVSQQCGAGPVTLVATGTPGTTYYEWYTTEFGTPLPGKTGSTYITDSLLPGTYTYYVKAVGAGCKSVYNTPVKVTVDPTPTLQFTQTSPDICGYESSLKIVSSGDKQEVDLFKDSFDTFNNFVNVVENAAAGALESDWQLRPSPYVFTGLLTPAVSSGYNGGNYAAIVTDKARKTNLLNHLTLKNSINSTGFQNLKLDFDFYNFLEVENDILKGYVKVQYSIDNGLSWLDIPPTENSKSVFTEGHGIPTKWDRISILLPSEALNQSQLKFRFSMFAFGDDAEYMANLSTIDNIRIYGDKPLETLFSWEGTGLSVFKADCVNPYAGAPTNEICIKPTRDQIEESAQFTLTAKASLNNGCFAQGSIVINNNSKTWNTAAATYWAQASDWKPLGSPGVPTAEHCVIVKSPVVIGADLSAFAKNLRIETGGKLDIEGNLTVTDFVVNKNTEGDHLILKSDANLIQLNDSKTMNEGLMLAEREVQGIKYNPASGPAQVIDYVYWSSPVLGQKTKGAGGFSPGTPANRFYSYRESNDNFYETGDLTFTPGRGYAVRAEEGLGNPYAKTYKFRGIPNNGDVAFGIIRTPDNPVVRGYNMVGNPYPSNIDFDELYAGNPGLIYNTAWFWTNSTFTLQQMGSGYAGNNYAVYNGSGGVPATYDPESPYTGSLVPNGVIKVGQGFLVQKKEVGTGNLIFKNSYSPGHSLRVADSGIFFTKGASQKNRFWLKLSSPNGLVNTQLIGYFPEATDGYEQDYDAEIMSMSSDLFYSKLGNMELVIQGKSNFVVEDKVTLGANFYQNGSYTIALDNAEGIFNDSQNIYLKDKQENIITNLSQGTYTFTATKGNSTGRFEIVYKPETVLATVGALKDELVVYRDAGDFVLRATSKKMDSVEVYDTAGRMIYKVEPHQTKVVIPADLFVNGVYVLKIKQKEQISIRKIIK